VKLPEQGLIVLSVEPESEAARVGLAVGDVITRYGGIHIAELGDLRAAQTANAVDVEAELVFDRRGEPHGVAVTTGLLGVTVGSVADPGNVYNAACALARDGAHDDAFAFLAAAATRGWRDADWFRKDPDLAVLRTDPRWPDAVAAVEASRASYEAKVNVELYELYRADQDDRQDPTMEAAWDQVAARDRERRTRVRELLAAGAVRAADDHYHAAMILQHGSEPADYELAHELAVKAAELRPSPGLPARWLAAATKDRHLLSLGEKQWFGTQSTVEDGVWTLLPIDEDAVTDSERRAWDVPTLEETRQALAARNTAADGG
jgi:hypothetical protein